MFIIFKKFVLCKYFTNEKLYILNALLISLLQLKLLKKLFYKISLFSYILTPEITYNCCPAAKTYSVNIYIYIISPITLVDGKLDIVTCESRDIRLRGNHVTYSPYSGEQARSNGLVRSTLLSRSRKGCWVVQRKIASRTLSSFLGISKGEGTRPFDLARRLV
jgi:hypothetical protein